MSAREKSGLTLSRVDPSRKRRLNIQPPRCQNANKRSSRHPAQQLDKRQNCRSEGGDRPDESEPEGDGRVEQASGDAEEDPGADGE